MNFINLFYFSSEQTRYWLLFGFIGFLLGFIRDEKTFYLKRIIITCVLCWNFIVLQFRLDTKTFIEVFIKYSLTQTVVFFVVYKLSEYFNKKESIDQIEDLIAQRLIQEHSSIVPALDSSKFTIVKGMQHIREREHAIKKARKSLVITSGWVSNYVFNSNFVDSIQTLLNKGVQVRLVYGYIDNKGVHKSSTEAVEKLKKLELQNPNRLKIVISPNHTKIIVVDNEYAICGSFNWLSNNRIKNEEISFKSKHPEVINELNLFIRSLVN